MCVCLLLLLLLAALLYVASSGAALYYFLVFNGISSVVYLLACVRPTTPTTTTSDKHADPVAGSPSPNSSATTTHPPSPNRPPYHSHIASLPLPPFSLAVSGMRLSLQLMAFNGIPVVFVFVSAFPALLLLLLSHLFPSPSLHLSLYLLKDLEQISKSISCVNFVSVYKPFRFSLAHLTAASSSFIYSTTS